MKKRNFIKIAWLLIAFVVVLTMLVWTLGPAFY